MSFLAVPGIISGRTGWTPAALAPELWIRADLGHSYADTDAVAAIANQGTAGSSANLAQGTGSLQPLYYVDGGASFNNQAVLYFDGTAVIYAAAGTWWHLSNESSSACLITVASTASASGAEQLLRTTGYTTRGGWNQSIRAAGACTSTTEESGGVVAIVDAGANGTQNATHVLASVLTGGVNPANDTLATWVDGVSAAATTGNMTNAVAASTNAEWNMGGNNTTTGSLVGYIAEMIYIKRALTGAEDDALRDYLNDRYGLALAGVTQ